MLIAILAILLLLVLSAIASGTETAVTGASEARLHRLAERGDSRALLLQRLLGDRQKLISTLLVSNNIFNIMAASLATGLFLDLVGEVGVAYATLVMTTLVVIFAEVLPKSYALHNADRVALWVARPLAALALLLQPVTFAIGKITGGLMRMLRIENEPDDLASAAEQLRGSIAVFGARGALRKHDRDMLEGILDLQDVTVEDVMTHRSRLMALDVETPVDKALAIVAHSSFSRIPVFEKDPDQIVGVLHARDFLALVPREGETVRQRSLRDLIQPAWFVPETTPLREQLQAFRRRHAHMALVVDEYGSLQGLVTLEDIIEEITGEIRDERDDEPQGFVANDDGSVTVDGDLPVRDLNRYLDWSLPEGEAATIAGVVLDEAERLPQAGEVIELEGYRIEVLERKAHWLSKLRVERLGEPKR